jgi:hypothetical protein
VGVAAQLNTVGWHTMTWRSAETKSCAFKATVTSLLPPRLTPGCPADCSSRLRERGSALSTALKG